MASRRLDFGVVRGAVRVSDLAIDFINKPARVCQSSRDSTENLAAAGAYMPEVPEAMAKWAENLFTMLAVLAVFVAL